MSMPFNESIVQATRYLFFTGKGGVGKTSLACATAVRLADEGKKVLLVSTDPASNLAHVFENDIGDHEPTPIRNAPNLFGLDIDPEAAVQAYRERIVDPVRDSLPPDVVRGMEEQLSGACTTEIAVFQAFSKVIQEARRKFVVLDTAPTGHTLLLLDATGSYHREIMRHAKEGLKIVTPMMQLQDRSQTKMLIVTLPETTPVLEAERLQDDLRRARIEPWAWVVNASLAAAEPREPLLRRRAFAEMEQIEKVRDGSAERTFVVPWSAEEPVGSDRLRRLAGFERSQAEETLKQA